MSLTSAHAPELVRLAGLAQDPTVAAFLRAHAATLAGSPATPAGASSEPAGSALAQDAGTAPLAPAAAPAPPRPAPSATPVPPAKSVHVQHITQYGWDQTATAVKIYITLAGVEDATVETSFTEKSITATIRGVGGCDRAFSLSLAEKISSCAYKTRNGRLVLTLAKAQPGSWAHLTAAEKKKADKDLDKVAAKGDPGDGLMSMMKKLYDDGDDEMKRTIAKAWTESREKGSGAGPF
eukprot:m.247932 g.247932  ORF g.247932 m.247932 type:complete len:237 (-) comp15573_c0_seq1:76-786(-)